MAGRSGRAALPSLDAVDRELLRLLAADGRMPMAGLAAAAGISRARAYARIERLRTDGVIEGFSARVNPRLAGTAVTAMILISMRQPAWRTLRGQIAAMPEVEYCALTTGEYDVLALVRVADVETLRDVILERIQTLEDVRATQTVFILEEVLRRPYVVP